MTPEIEEAAQDWITAARKYNEAEQGYMDIKDQFINETLDYAKTQQNINKLREQRKKLKTEEHKLIEQIGIEQRKARKILDTLENNWDYKIAKNNLIGARDKLDIARNYLEHLIAKEAENDTANSNRA